MSQLELDLYPARLAPRTIAREARLRPCDLRGRQRRHFDELLRAYSCTNPDSESVAGRMRIFMTDDGPYLRLAPVLFDRLRRGGDFFLGAGP